MNLLTWRNALTRPQIWNSLSLVTLMLMEMTALSLWYQSLFRVDHIAWSLLFAILVTVLLISHFLTIAMDRFHWGMISRQAVFFVWLIAAAFVSLKLILFRSVPIGWLELAEQPFIFIFRAGSNPSSFFHLLGVGLLVWHGVAMAGNPASLLGTQISFQVGLIWMLIYGMAFAPSHPREATIGLYLFLFFGLISMSAARLAGLTELRGGRIRRFGPGWISSILAAALSVVALSIFTGWLASNRVVAFVVRIIVYLLTAITGLLMMLFYPILLALAQFLPKLVDFITQLVNRIAGIKVPKFISDAVAQIAEAFEKVIPAIIAGRGILLAAIIGIVLFAILLGLRLRDRDRREVEEEDTGSAAMDENTNPLRRLINAILQQRRSLRLRSPGQLLAAARIRQIYRQLMALSNKLGEARPPSTTPLEFVPQMEKIFPEQRPDLDQITSAYVRVRYGEYPETIREVDDVEAAWERVRRQGKRTIAALKKSKAK